MTATPRCDLWWWRREGAVDPHVVQIYEFVRVLGDEFGAGEQEEVSI
jgi:hypothetical protein